MDLSTEWILKFLKLILKDREVLKEAFVFSNPNLVEIGEKLLNQKLHFYQLNISKIVLTDLNSVLAEIIETCKTPFKISSLVDLLLEKGFELNTIYDYIQQLIDSEILFLECFEILTKDIKINLIDIFLYKITLLGEFMIKFNCSIRFFLMRVWLLFHYRSYGAFFLQQNRLHNSYSGFTHYRNYRAVFFSVELRVLCSNF